jgi:hypothetical protein
LSIFACGGVKSRQTCEYLSLDHMLRSRATAAVACGFTTFFVLRVDNPKFQGVGYDAWTRVHGFSEAVIAWIAASEETKH